MKQDSTRRILILGCGYLGVRVGELLSSRGLRVTATTTRPDRIEELREHGLDAQLFDFARSEESSVWQSQYNAVLCSAAPGRTGDPRIVFRSGPVSCGQTALAAGVERFVFVSTTGVYHQDDGAWVTEESPACPVEERHRTIRAAEEELLALGAVILRLGGLYGPGRSPIDWLKRPEMRERILRGEGAAWMSWIRVEDAAVLCALSLEKALTGKIYLGVDGEPVRRGDFYRFAAEQAGLPPPEFPTKNPQSGKRCDNQWTRAQLGFQPKYPTYRAGLEGL